MEKQDWQFVYQPEKVKLSFRHRMLYALERATGYRVGEYKNYRLVKG